MTEKTKELGERIKIALKKAKIKQYELAQRTGKYEADVSRWIKGLVAPNFEILIKIHNITGCDLKWLLVGEEDVMVDADSLSGYNSDNQIIKKEEPMSDQERELYERLISASQEIANLKIRLAKYEGEPAKKLKSQGRQN